MHHKIKLAMIDDDDSMHDIISDLYADSNNVELKYKFKDPRDFIREAPLLEFDLCLLDINMPHTTGLVVAQLLRDKPFIFVTGSEDKLKDALNMEPIDIVTKPFNKERLDHAIEKAIKLLRKEREYMVFNVAESKRRVSIKLSDIVFVYTDDVDPRNKILVLASKTKYTLMDHSLGELLLINPELVQINRRELVSLNVINEVAHDLISIKNAVELGIPEELTIGTSFKDELKRRIFFK